MQVLCHVSTMPGYAYFAAVIAPRSCCKVPKPSATNWAKSSRPSGTAPEMNRVGSLADVHFEEATRSKPVGLTPAASRLTLDRALRITRPV